MAKLGATCYECYEDRTGLKMALLVTIKRQRPSAIAKAVETHAATKSNAPESVILREVGLSPLVMTFSRNNEASREDNFIFKGIKKAIATGDPSYHKWEVEKTADKKAKRIHKELEIDMVHKPLEPRKKVRATSVEEEEEEMPIIEESSVPFEQEEEEAPPPPLMVASAAPEANAREAADILDSMMAAPPPPAPVLPHIDEEEVAGMKELNAELRGELRGMTVANSCMEVAVEGHKDAAKGYKEVVKSKASEIRILRQTLKDTKVALKESKAKADHFERLSFQLRGQLGSSQREVNRPVRDENDRLVHDNEWLQERIEVNEKRILPTLKSISRRVR